MSKENVAAQSLSVKRKQSTQPLPRTDAGNAEFFTALWKERVRYHHGRKCWFLWQGHWWAEDSKQEVMQLAKRAIRFRRRQAHQLPPEYRGEEIEWTYQSESKRALEAVLSLAMSEPKLSASGDEWDKDPYLFGVANGVLNLRTGKLRQGRPRDLISVHTDVAYDAKATCPRWLQFLDEIFGGDRELIHFIHKAIGYCLTGETTEQAIFLCCGIGANGKSTYLEVVRHACGGYGFNLPFASFEMKARADIPNDLAALCNRRFVTANETNESAQLNEARIKSLTGGDKVTARFLHKEWFEFVPKAKYWLAVNAKPQVADDSEGFWRRMRVIPFNQNFSKDKADKDLLSTLKKEAPGILAWAVEGCLAWQREGLGVPQAIADATSSYKEESDEVGEFIEDLCIVQKDACVSATELWRCYHHWAFSTSRKPLERKVFSARLQAKQFHKKRFGHARDWTWFGLRIRLEIETVASIQVVPAGSQVI